AEDGIRDFHVTGVQTCALPILLKADEMKDIDRRASSEFGIPSIILMENAGLRTLEVIEEILGGTKNRLLIILAGKGNNGGDGLRSEERRVGKGCRAGEVAEGMR